MILPQWHATVERGPASAFRQALTSQHKSAPRMASPLGGSQHLKLQRKNNFFRTRCPRPHMRTSCAETGGASSADCNAMLRHGLIRSGCGSAGRHSNMQRSVASVAPSGRSSKHVTHLSIIQYGCGSKLSNWGYAGCSLPVHLPGFHFGPPIFF